MTKTLARLIVSILIGTAALAGGGARVGPRASPTISRVQIAGSYLFHTEYGGSSYSKHSIKLFANHTGSDGIAGDKLTWKTKGKKITIVGKFALRYGNVRRNRHECRLQLRAASGQDHELDRRDRPVVCGEDRVAALVLTPKIRTGLRTRACRS